MGVKEREFYLDICKGIGIILVIYNHCSIGFETRFFSLFHIPLFFIVSGLCTGSAEKKDYIKKYARG
jgi:fucose 4-O-acetylase-like acetyltransferase